MPANEGWYTYCWEEGQGVPAQCPNELTDGERGILVKDRDQLTLAL